MGQTTKKKPFKVKAEKPGYGIAFKNYSKFRDTQPDYVAQVMLHDGTVVDLGLYEKQTTTGKTYFQISQSKNNKN